MRRLVAAVAAVAALAAAAAPAGSTTARVPRRRVVIGGRLTAARGSPG